MSSNESTMCCTVQPLCCDGLVGFDMAMGLLCILLLCDSREGRVSQWADLPFTQCNIFIRADGKLYGSQSGAGMEPGEQEEKQAFMRRTKDRQGIQIEGHCITTGTERWGMVGSRGWVVWGKHKLGEIFFHVTALLPKEPQARDKCSLYLGITWRWHG